jgi:hypothetical protein
MTQNTRDDESRLANAVQIALLENTTVQKALFALFLEELRAELDNDRRGSFGRMVRFD